MTPVERLLWERLRGGQLNGQRFRRQQIIAGFIVDFYCHAASLVIEVDGGVHNEQNEYDHERDRAISAHNLRVVRVSNDEVELRLDVVLERIRSYLPQQPLSATERGRRASGGGEVDSGGE